MKIKRWFRQIAVQWLIKFFTTAIRSCIAWEIMMAKQEECKHEGQEGRGFCGNCGKQLIAEEENELDAIVERVLTKHGVIKAKKPKGEPEPEKRGNLADRLLKKEKK